GGARPTHRCVTRARAGDRQGTPRFHPQPPDGPVEQRARRARCSETVVPRPSLHLGPGLVVDQSLAGDADPLAEPFVALLVQQHHAVAVTGAGEVDTLLAGPLALPWGTENRAETPSGHEDARNGHPALTAHQRRRPAQPANPNNSPP